MAAEIGGEEGVEDALVLLERHRSGPRRDDAFASLCSRHKAANSGLMMLAARTPGTLSAAMAMPMPFHTQARRARRCRRPRHGPQERRSRGSRHDRRCRDRGRSHRNPSPPGNPPGPASARSRHGRFQRSRAWHRPSPRVLLDRPIVGARSTPRVLAHAFRTKSGETDGMKRETKLGATETRLGR